jgi:hypothetical protein
MEATRKGLEKHALLDLLFSSKLAVSGTDGSGNQIGRENGQIQIKTEPGPRDWNSLCCTYTKI